MTDSDANVDIDWEEWNPKELSFAHHMTAGSLAGLAEHISVFPIDTIKTQIQCEKCGSTSLFQSWSCASRMVRKEGVFRLWRGVGATFSGCLPAHAAYFSVYETVKRYAAPLNAVHDSVHSGIAGASAALAHDVFMNPFDVVKQQMQLGYHQNFRECIRNILRQDGIRGFYISLPTTLFMNIPHGYVQVATNDFTRKYLDPSGSYSSSTLLLSGSIAGAVAAFVTNPLDVIKTRLQTQHVFTCPKQNNSYPIYVGSSSGIAAMRLTGAREIAFKILSTEGLRVFFRGSSARILIQSPGCAVSWTVYENLKRYFSNDFRR